MSEEFISKMLVDHYLIDISNNIPLIITFNSFIKFHSEFYQQKVNHRVVIANNMVSSNVLLDDHPEVCIIYDEPVKFVDSIHNVSGYIITGFQLDDMPNGSVRQLYTFKIWIEKDKQVYQDNLQYHTQVQEYMKRQARHGNRVQLYYYKILNEQLITHNFYDRKLADWNDDIKILRQEFFSPHKRYLFDVMQENRNGNWSNLILYGEPGTGKSSFVFRLATQLKMSIISVDLSMYIDRKRDLYSIFHGNEFYLPYGKGQKLTVSQNCIIILEEFDSSIEKIKQLENIFLFKSDTIHSYVNNKTSEIGKKVQDAIYDFVQPDVPLSSPMDYLNSRQTANNPIDPLKITNEIFDIVRTITEDNKSDILRLRDLLELFQGPVPIRDRIIVATTNNFEQIKGIIPPLFRPGRLTPIRFTYLDWESLVELCGYYFNSELNVTPFEVVIPTSQITELAIKYVSMAKASATKINDLFEEFIQELFELNEFRKDAMVKESAQELLKPIQELPKIDPPTNDYNVNLTSSVHVNKPSVGNNFHMYENWVDTKLGTPSQPQRSKADTVNKLPNQQTRPLVPKPVQPLKKSIINTQDRPLVPRSGQPQERQMQRRPVAKNQPPKSVQPKEDDRIRTMVVDKVMDKDRDLINKLPGYNKEELVSDYLNTAVMVPQHDDDY